VLVGREAELAELQGRVRRLADGIGFGVVLQGGAGIGKTAVLGAIADWAEGCAHVLRTSGMQRETELVFAGIGELVAPLHHLIDGLPDRHRSTLRSSLSLGESSAHSVSETLVAVTSLLAVSAEVGPVLCLVDDVHWLDAASVDALLFAVNRLRSAGVGFVFAARDDRASPLDMTSIPRMELRPLAPLAAETLLRSTNPDLAQETRAELIATAEGYPLALIEFATQVERDPMSFAARTPIPVSDRIERVYGEQAMALGPAGRRALVVLAASEQQLVHIVEPAIARLCSDPDALDTAVDSGLVRLQRDRYTFRHPLVRSAIYQGASQAERRAAHRALADVLIEVHPELAAWHRALGAVAADEQIAAALERTAESARRRGGRLAEARALELAARLSPAEDHAIARLLAAGAAALPAGKHVMARTLLGEVLRRSSDVRILADAQHLLAQVEFWQDGRVSPKLIAAAERVEPVDPMRAARLLSFALVPMISDCQISKGVPIAKRAWSLIDYAVEPFEVAFRVAHILVMTGDPDGASITQRAAAAAEAAGNVVAMIMISQPLWWLERYQDARRLLDVAVATAREDDAIWTLCHGLINQAELERRTGWPVLARAAAAEALAIAEQIGDPMQRAEALVQLAAAEAHIDDHVQARAHAEQALRLVQERSAGATELQLTAGQALARVALSAGRPVEAVNHLQPLIDRVINNGLGEPGVLPGVVDLLDAQIGAGRRDDAARLESWLAAAADRCGRRWVGLTAARAAAMRSPLTELDRLRQALDEDTGETKVVTARAWLTYGELLRRGGERSRARVGLARADHLLHIAGAESWYEQVAAELRACGESGRNLANTPALTPQEERVARLAVTGARNREIANQLSVSEKTVETHLAAVFRKLGIRSRTELAARYQSSD
jgi:DNA-binding CsgD family transcriptional regulator